MPAETYRRIGYKGPLSKEPGFPMKIVAVHHGSITFHCKKGQHSIIVSRKGNLNTGKETVVTMTYTKAVEKAKRMALKMGENTAVFTHGASENTQNWQVQGGKLKRLM